MKIRIYKDTENRIMAQSLHDGNMPENVVFNMVLPVGNAMVTLLFTDMPRTEAQNIAMQNQEKLLQAIAAEGTRIGLQDVTEEYYMLEFTLHPDVAKKERNRLPRKIAEAIEKNDGWMNHIVLNVAPFTYRYDCAIKHPEETRQAIARILKSYGRTSEFIFRKNDF